MLSSNARSVWSKPWIRVAELRRDENVSPAEQRSADAVLVPIHRRCIDRAIALLDRQLDHLLRRYQAASERPQAQIAAWPRRR